MALDLKAMLHTAISFLIRSQPPCHDMLNIPVSDLTRIYALVCPIKHGGQYRLSDSVKLGPLALKNHVAVI